MDADRAALNIIAQKQKEAFGASTPFGINRSSSILRRRLLEKQNLQKSGPWSLGVDRLDQPPHWPKDDYPGDVNAPEIVPVQDANTVKLTLLEALQIGAANSFDYQTEKEDVFRAALALDLQRDAFRDFFTEQLGSAASTDSSGRRTVSGTRQSSVSGISRLFKTGAAISTQFAVDLANLLTAGGASSLGLRLDSSVSIPLLRGSGRHIVTEPLTQAERNVLYAVWQFERFKRVFAVDVARGYLSVLRALDQVENEQGNYRRAIMSARWSQRRADKGEIDIVQVDQALQNELSARNRWIQAMQNYDRSLDQFKQLLGLPVDAKIELDRGELERLTEQISSEMVDLSKFARDPNEEVPPADAPIVLTRPSRAEAGRYEVDPAAAVKLAFDNRLDLRVAQERVYDAQRQVVVLADRLGAELTLGGSATMGGRRDVGSATSDDARVRFNQAAYSALLSLDLPIERVAERNDYRNGLIDLERAVRAAQSAEDRVKLEIRDRLRVLESTRESLQIQASAVEVARRRVRGARLALEAGRAQIRDILEAQDALVSAQNALTAAVINYRVAELELQRDIGLLKVDEKGLWQEFDPEVMQK